MGGGGDGDLSAERWEQYYLLTSAFGIARFFAPGECLAGSWAALPRGQYQGFLKLGPEVWALAFTDASGPFVAAWSEAPTRVPPSALAPVLDERALRGSGALQGTDLLLGPRPVFLRGLDTRLARPGAPTRGDVLAASGRADLSGLPAVSADYWRSEQPEVGLYDRALRGLPGGAVREDLRTDNRRAVGTDMRPGEAKTTTHGSISTWTIAGSTRREDACRSR